ncbi:MAG: hypothetical protein PHH54_06455 [Candidatus Nanoarchaeia archaeon]|nr:hypothetical protein [Candidatus Nanoarchaeia archaeon]MDD5741597.1 hypothetical protein [Candidatus Nanoarchaeia archaeon]
MTIEKSEKLRQIEEIIWKNLNTGGIIQRASDENGIKEGTLLKEIVGHSYHACSVPLEKFNGVDICTEYAANTRTHQYDIWIDPRIVARNNSGISLFQPVSMKLYRLNNDEEIQKKFFYLIWKNVKFKDINQIALEAAKEYYDGNKWIDVSKEISIKKFYPAILKGNVGFSPCLTNAGYRVHLRGHE